MYTLFVGQYASKGSISKNKKNMLAHQSMELEELCATHIKESVKVMENILRNLLSLVSPVIDIDFEMQDQFYPVGMKEVNTRSSGMWQSSICENTKTSILHTKEDCTYTFCKVPSQILNDVKDCNYQIMFFVQINDNEKIAIPLAINL